MIYPNPQIYHHLKTIFVHVPKAAGTSIEQALRASPKDVVGGHTTAVGFRSKYGELFHQYYKFALVRHPVDRFISAFHYRLQRPVHPALGNEVVHQAGSLDAFLEKLAADPGLIFRIVHLLPQHQFICDATGSILVDSIFKFENLPFIWKDISQRIGLPYHPLPKTNPSVRDHWEAYANPGLTAFVRAAYARDFTLFSYPLVTQTASLS